MLSLENEPMALAQTTQHGADNAILWSDWDTLEKQVMQTLT